MYFLDFETLDFVIPRFNNTKSNEKLPYQASLHILEDMNKPIIHQELLVNPYSDPREEMIKFLIKHINTNESVAVYNASFERSVIKTLANEFPKYSKRLLEIVNQIVDLLDVFKKGMVYNKEMKNSFSIKVVYPAICPLKKEAYHNLEEVHNGTEAMDALEELAKLKGNELKIKRKQLLEYCFLDTWSMVEIYYKLLEFI